MSLPLRLITSRVATVASRSIFPIATKTATRLTVARFSTDNITYSGGQAMVGQGGFYGSGGARALAADPPTEEDQKKQMIALQHDVDKVRAVMQEVETLESLLQREESVSGRSIELKGNIKKLMTQPDLISCLSRLEIKGEPVWGLSQSERELIISARDKINDC